MASEQQIGIALKVQDKASAAINTITGKIDKLGEKTRSTATALEAIGTLMALKKITEPLNRLRNAVVKDAATMTDSLSALSARSGIAMETLEKAIVKSAGEAGSAADRVGYSTSKVTSMFDQLSRSGVIRNGMLAEEMSRINYEMLNFAKVTQISDSAVADYADKIGDIWGSDRLAERMSRLHFQAVRMGGTFEEVFELMVREGDFLSKSMGLSFEQVSDSLTSAATGSALPAKKVGAAIQASIQSLIKPSQEAIKVLNKLGITREDVFKDGKLRQVEGENPIVTFLKQFEGASFEDLYQMFGAQASIVQSLIAKTDEIGKLSKTDFGNSADEMERRAQAANGLFGELSRTMVIFKNKIMRLFEPVAVLLTQVVRKFNDFLSGNLVASWAGAITVAFAGIAAMVGSIVVQVLSLKKLLAHLGLTQRLKKFCIFFKPLISAVSKLFGAVLKLSPTIRDFTKLFARFASVAAKISRVGTALFRIFGIVVRFAGPVGLAISAIVEWVNVFQMLWGRFGDFLEGLIYMVKHPIDAIQTLFFGFVDDIKAAIQSLVGYLPDFIKTKLGLSVTANNPAVDHVTAGEVHDAMKAAHAARVGGDVNVNFANAPAGMRVTTEPRPGTTLPTNVGYNLLSPAWGMGG